MQLTPEMIREQSFKSKFSGFDKDEVTNFLIDVAEDLEELLEENALIKSELETLKSKQKDQKFVVCHFSPVQCFN